MSRFMTWVAPTARGKTTLKIDTSAFKTQYVVLWTYDAVDSNSWHVRTYRTLAEAEAVYREQDAVIAKNDWRNGCVLLQHISKLFTS